MNLIFRKIKELLFPKRLGYEYLVNIDDIVIQESFARSQIRKDKWDRKVNFYLEHGYFESPVYIRATDWVLVDGYSSYKIAEQFGLGKIPVYFI